MTAAIPESAILNACLRWLWANRCFCWRHNSGSFKNTYTRKDGSIGNSHIRFGLPGSADIIGMNPHGVFLAVETKRAGKGLEPHQEKFRDQVHEHGGIYVLAHGIDDLEAHKTEILAAHLPARYAEGYHPDYRVRSGSHRQSHVDEVMA